MNEIRVLLHLTARRLETSRFLSIAHVAGLVVASLAVMLMIADRVTAEPFVPWPWVGPALAAIALLATLALWSRRRLSQLQVALAVDERLDLREKLSTALHCRDRKDAFARAAVEDAVAVARDPKIREKARRVIKVDPPRGWWISPVIALAALALAFVPQLNLFAPEPGPDQQVVKTQLETQKSIEAVINEIKKDETLTESVSDLLGELSNDPLSGHETKSPADIKRDALRKVSDLNERLEKILKGEDAQQAAALNQALNQLKSPQDGPAKDLTDALAQGDFKGAQDALQKMMDQLQKGELTPEQQKQLAEQMKQVADQLQQLAEQQQALEDALKQAGMDPQLAQNPQAMQQAIQNNPNLNEQQKQQLQQMAQAQQQACQACQNMGQACGQMAQAMQQGNNQQAGQAGQQMQQMLNNMEGMQQMMRAAQAAQQKCQGQASMLGQKLGGQCQGGQDQQQWMMQAQGGAFGQRGQGAGGQAPKSRTPFRTKDEFVPGVTNPEDDVIFRQFIEGQQIKGESTAKLKSVVATATEGLKQGVKEEDIPRKYAEAHKHYFGELEARIKAQEAAKPTPAPPGTPPSEPPSEPK